VGTLLNSKVAVLLAAYEGCNWIEEQVNSILIQKNVDVTLYISVDQSTDGTERWVDQLAATEPNVVVLQHGLTFGGAGRNFFRLIRDVNLSRYDYISFADQDDIWDEFKLNAAITELHGKSVDAYSSNVLAFWPDGKTQLIVKSQPQMKYDFFFEAAGPGCTYVFTKQLACHLKQFVIENWTDIQNVALHDWFFYAFARANGYKWFIDERYFMSYRQHQNNQVGVNSGFNALRKRSAQVFNGSWLGQIQLIASILRLDKSDFVKSWRNFRFFGSLGLAAKAFQCRRRVRDKLTFMFFFTLISLRFNK